MLDRIEDIRKIAHENYGVFEHPADLEDKETSASLNNDRELIMEFLGYTKDVQQAMQEMEDNNRDMRGLVQQLINDKKSSSNQQILQDNITGLIGENQISQNMIKEKLHCMTDDLNESKKLHKDEPETRVKQQVYTTLATKFRNILRNTQSIQTDFKSTVQGKIKRQLKIAKKDATDEELDEIARDPERAQQMLQEQLQGQRQGAHSKIKNTVDDIQNKYKDILRLEQNVNDLFELFQELATLIQAQGEMLDNIEANLEDANDYMEKAEDHLYHARELHTEARSKSCCLLICIACVLIGLYFAIF